MGEKAKREYVKRCDRQFIDCVSVCAKNVLKVTFRSRTLR